MRGRVYGTDHPIEGCVNEGECPIKLWVITGSRTLVDPYRPAPLQTPREWRRHLTLVELAMRLCGGKAG
jgi:hypothetical protein